VAQSLATVPAMGLLSRLLLLGLVLMTTAASAAPFDYVVRGDVLEGAPSPGDAFPTTTLTTLDGASVDVPDADRYVILELIRSADW